MARSFSAIVLIGMSGVGKSHWANIYGKGGCVVSADDQIADKISYKMRGAGIADEDENIDKLAAFVGKFGGERYGGFARDEFFSRQEIYLGAELEGSHDFLSMSHAPSLPRLYDTTGSFCEVFTKYAGGGAHRPMDGFFVDFMKGRACVVYLACGQQERKILLDRQLERPKPMVYDREFFEACLQDYRRQQSVAEEDIVPDDFLRFVFPKAIEHRSARYAELARVTVMTFELESLLQKNPPSTFANAFVKLVRDKLSDKERSASRAQQEIA